MKKKAFDFDRLADFAADFFFPNRCPCCDKFIPYDELICKECSGGIVYGDFCRICGHSPCQCKEQKNIYDGCAVLIEYRGAGRDGILALKYYKGLNAAKYLVPKLYGILEENGFLAADIITAAPMTGARRNVTGYNHAEYIAKLISKRSGIPADFSLIGKRKNAGAQHFKSGRERAEAAKNAYKKGKRGDLSGKTVLLCDDIITTGSTLNACSKILKESGAEKVYCAVLAGGTFKACEEER